MTGVQTCALPILDTLFLAYGIFRIFFEIPYKIYNIGNNKPVELLRFIGVIEQAMGKSAQKNFLPMQPGDVPRTYADIDDLIQDVGFKPTTTIEQGIENFVQWYQYFYQPIQLS